MNLEEFEEVAWRHIYDALHDVPRLFQLWACKQVMDVVGTNHNQAKQTTGEHDPHRTSCNQEIETCSHVLHCNEEGRVDALLKGIQWFDT